MSDLQTTVGQVIRRLRREQGLRRHELADRAAVSEVYLGEIERGEKYPSARVLEQIATALDHEPADLLEAIAADLRMPVATAATMPIELHPVSKTETPRGALDSQASLVNSMLTIYMASTSMLIQNNLPSHLTTIR
jgi:transcriptional regulator with XRE-family HTH domain